MMDRVRAVVNEARHLRHARASRRPLVIGRDRSTLASDRSTQIARRRHERL